MEYSKIGKKLKNIQYNNIKKIKMLSKGGSILFFMIK